MSRHHNTLEPQNLREYFKRRLNSLNGSENIPNDARQNVFERTWLFLNAMKLMAKTSCDFVRVLHVCEHAKPLTLSR